jgi:hypothetical protein
MLYADFERQGMEHPGRAVAFGVFVEVLVSTLMLSATWAFFITRKAKKVMRAAGFPLVEEVTANASRSDLELFVKGPVQESEGATMSAPAAPALFAPTKPAKRSKMRALLDTGWGRLFIVAWVAWAGWRLFEVNRLVERRFDCWEAEPFMNLVMTGLVFPLVAVLVVLWVARGFKKTVG